MRLILLVAILWSLIIYLIYGVFNDWYICNKNNGVFVKGVFGYECIHKDYLNVGR